MITRRPATEAIGGAAVDAAPSGAIGLDTKVSGPLLTQDDPLQARLKTELTERRPSEQDPGFTSVVAMVERPGQPGAPKGSVPRRGAAVIERGAGANWVQMSAMFTAMVALKEGRGFARLMR